MEYKLLMRDDEKLYNLIENEISKNFTFKKLCKDIELDNENISEDFKKNQCYYMCNQNLSSIKKCKNNSIDNIIINSRQVKKLKILKKTYVSDEELSVVTIASTKINDVENKIIIKDFYDEHEMMYELFIANILKNDQNIEKHICGYFGKKSNTSKLLLEYIQGKTITEITDLSIKDFSDIISQVFLTLNYAYNKYGFLHGDLHTDNFLVIYEPTNKFDIELFLSNGKSIKYKSNYKVVFIDFGLSHITYKFKDNKNNENLNVLMIPLDQDILGFDYSIPLVDVTKLLVFIMIEIIYENKHNKLTEVSIYITKFIEKLYSIIGKYNKQINFNFFKKTRSEYGYIYDLINSNLELSFEELYIMFVSNTHMDIHKINEYFNKDEQLLLKEDLEENDNVLNIIQNITNNNINLDDKIYNIKDYLKEYNLEKLNKSQNSKSKLNKERLKYICINFFHYLCKYELNKNIFIDENEMINVVNKIYLKFYNNKIITDLSENEKFKVIDNMIEFKLNKFLDNFLKNVNIHNILIKYNKLTEVSIEQAYEFEEEQNINKILKRILIKNYIKMPFKIFQKNFIDNEINVKKYNQVEQISFLANIVLELKKQMEKLNISNKTININIEKFKKIQIVSNRSEFYHLHLFFYNIYKYCENNSINIVEQSKFEFIDWISYNKIILYDYFIRHITLMNLPKCFTTLYLSIIELDDEIWEKFYKKEDFKDLANSLTFSENMLHLIVNKDFSKLLSKIDISNSNNKIKDNINFYIKEIQNKKNELTKNQINIILNQFKKMYKYN